MITTNLVVLSACLVTNYDPVPIYIPTVYKFQPGTEMDAKTNTMYINRVTEFGYRDGTNIVKCGSLTENVSETALCAISTNGILSIP